MQRIFLFLLITLSVFATECLGITRKQLVADSDSCTSQLFNYFEDIDVHTAILQGDKRGVTKARIQVAKLQSITFKAWNAAVDFSYTVNDEETAYLKEGLWKYSRASNELDAAFDNPDMYDKARDHFLQGLNLILEYKASKNITTEQDKTISEAIRDW